MIRFQFTAVALVCSLLTVGCTSQPARTKGQQPNIVVFIADDISAEDFGCYGNTYAKTPHIDALASQGIQFNQAFLTTSSCSPSRASILTGRYPHNTGAPELHMPLPPELPNLARILKASGYTTGASGKWHLGEAVRKDFTWVMDRDIGPGGEARWMELLDSVPDSKPFFLWFASLDAHRPWDMDNVQPSESLARVPLSPYLIQEDSATQRDMAQYFDEVHRFDTHVGSVVNELMERNLLKNTIVVILSDNGRPFPRDKTRMYDSGLQTPLIVYRQGAEYPVGSHSDALISSIDLAPTLLHLAGIPSPPSFQGVSFASVLEDVTLPHRQYVFGEHNWHDYQALERMVRSGDFLLIENEWTESPMSSAADVHAGSSFQSLVARRGMDSLDPQLERIHFAFPRPGLELYQVSKDPYQLNNLSADMTYKDQLNSLRAALAAWRQFTGDHTATPMTRDHYDYFTATPLFPERSFLDVHRGNLEHISKALSISSTDSVFLVSHAHHSP